MQTRFYLCFIRSTRAGERVLYLQPPYSLDELVEALWRHSDRFWGHQRIHVVGHSLGGQIGPAYARTILNVWRQSHFSVLQQAGLLRIVPRSRVWSYDGGKKGVKPLLKTLINRWFTDEFFPKFSRFCRGKLVSSRY
ncbi:MAG: hypothetical protein Ct9H300mP28_10910 [Pseudomonadota bacterium]|nr:MAG: hypothetical protein Ct9H300mP28_10910 [Pseudomonadota bacterium]